MLPSKAETQPKTKKLSGFARKAQKTRNLVKRRPTQPAAPAATNASVCAAREQCHQDHQVRQGEQPLIRLNSRCFRGTRDKAQMTALREVVQVVHANPREIGHLIIGKNLLARFDGYHGPDPLS